MSLSGILTPNNYTVYCGTIDAQNIIYKDESFSSSIIAGNYQGMCLPNNSVNGQLIIEKIGQVVTITVQSIYVIGTGASSTIVYSDLIPVEYRPQDSQLLPFFCITNNLDSAIVGTIAVNINGTIRFGTGLDVHLPPTLPTLKVFASDGTTPIGWASFSVSYAI